MPRHLRHYGWLYLTLVVLIGWPVFVIRSQSGPPLDVPTLRRLVTIYRDGFVRAHPQLQVRDMRERSEIHFQHDAPYVDRVLGSWPGGAPATPVLQPDVERLAQREAAHFAMLDDLAARGVVYCPFPPDNAAAADTTATVPDPNALVPEFLGMQTLCKVRRAEARVAIEEQRWDEALRSLESAAHIGATVRYEAMIGSLIAVATRAIAYGGYTELLHAGPPSEVQRAALASLLALRASDPVLDDWTLASERSYSIQLALASSERKIVRPELPGLPAVSARMQSIDSQGMRLVYALRAGEALIRLRSHIQDPALRSQADALAARYPFLSNGEMLPSTGPRDLKWTILPALRKWLEQVARKEPWVYQDPTTPETGTQGLDRWTLTVARQALSSWHDPNHREASARGRTVETQGALLRVAFAANLYREQHGGWPGDLRDLAEFRPVPEEAGPTTTTAAVPSTGTLRLPTDPFLPIRFAEREVTDEIRQTLCGTILPRSAIPGPQASGGARIGPDGRIMGPVGVAASQSGDKVLQNDEIDLVVAAKFGGLSEWLKQPVLMVAVGEALNAHPRLVEWAKIEVGYRKDVPATQGEFVELRPLDAALARRVTHESDRAQEKAAAATHGATTQSAATPAAAVAAQNATTTTTAASLPAETSGTQPALPPIAALRLTAKLRAPEKVMVIWSPGPDGVDDGGTITYDPSNGTMSRGDLIVYPEKF